MSQPQPSFDDKLASLRVAFAQRVQGEAAELEILLEGLRSQPDANENVSDIQRIAHRITGGAAVFGLAQLTGPASRVEEIILEGADVDEVCMTTRKLVDEIHDALAEHVPSHVR